MQQLHVRLKRAAELSRAGDDVARLRVVGVTVDAAAAVRKLSCDATGYSCCCCWFLYIRNASQIDTQEAQLTSRQAPREHAIRQPAEILSKTEQRNGKHHMKKHA